MKLPIGLVYMLVYNWAHFLATTSNVEHFSAIFYWSLEFSTSWSWEKRDILLIKSKGGLWRRAAGGGCFGPNVLVTFLSRLLIKQVWACGWSVTGALTFLPPVSMQLTCGKGKQVNKWPSTVELVLGKVRAAKSGSVFSFYIVVLVVVITLYVVMVWNIKLDL